MANVETLQTMDFYPRPPRGGRPAEGYHDNARKGNFYPRPPRGGRPAWRSAPSTLRTVFLSTPSSRRATLSTFLLSYQFWISIHALLAEGRHDRTAGPRVDGAISIHALLAEGDTQHIKERWKTCISIHALLAEGDLAKSSSSTAVLHFYPRPPRGGRQQKQRENTLLLSHYTPLCTNCKEMLANQTAKSHRYLRKRLVFRCEASRKTMCAADSHWPDIKRSARCLGQILGAVQRARPWSGSCCPAGRTADCPRQGRSGRSALL